MSVLQTVGLVLRAAALVLQSAAVVFELAALVLQSAAIVFESAAIVFELAALVLQSAAAYKVQNLPALRSDLSNQPQNFADLLAIKKGKNENRSYLSKKIGLRQQNNCALLADYQGVAILQNLGFSLFE